MNIVLLGYRGSGKTTIGRMLAEQLWKTFVDVDRETCKRFDCDSINLIWAEHGEPAWREMEVKVTQELLNKDEQVIALGGGTIMQPGAREALDAAADCTCIYLKCEPEELYRRITGDSTSGDSRPPLTKYGGGLEEIRKVLERRDPVYSEVADKVFDVTHTPPDDALRYIIKYCL